MKKEKDVFLDHTDERFGTPLALFQELEDEFGKFDLDAAAVPENALCSFYYTKTENGLVMRWAKKTYCNPPYQKGIGDWIKKGYEESLLGNLVVMLLPVDTSVGWFHDYCSKGEIRFLRGRLRYRGGKTGARFASMIVIFRPTPGYRFLTMVVGER